MSERNLTGYTLESPHGDQYNVRRVLGVGEQAIVYAGVQASSNEDPSREYALKVYRGSSKIVRAEAACYSKVNGRQNIVRMIEWADSMTANKDSDTCQAPVLVTTLADHSLEGLTLDESLDLQRALRLLGGGAVGLTTTHKAGVLHRDIQQGNFFVTALSRGEKVELGDFGVAVAENAPNIPPLITSIPHAAPENLEGWGASRAIDLYALGVVAFELISNGYPPFELPERTLAEKILDSEEPMRQVLKWREIHKSAGREVQPFPVNDAVYNNLHTVARQALAVNPDHRYPTALGLHKAFMGAYHRGMAALPKVIA